MIIAKRGGRVTEPGFYDMPAEKYHADPCPEPSLSGSIAKIMLDKSPRHAWTVHPRLNPNFVPDGPDSKLDFGTAAHKLLLGKGREVLVIDAQDWRTADARAQRAAAAAAGHVAILRRNLMQAETMVDAAHQQLELVDDCKLAFRDGWCELCAAWEEQGIWLRSLVDYIERPRTSGHIVTYDYKTTAASASPGAVARHLYDMSYEVQAAMIERALETLIGNVAGRVLCRFVVQEKEPPHLLTVVQLDPAGMMLGRKKVAVAIELWRRCIADNNWPGYPRQVVTAELPTWTERSWLMREDDEFASLADDPYLIASPWIPPVPPRTLSVLEAG